MISLIITESPLAQWATTKAHSRVDRVEVPLFNHRVKGTIDNKQNLCFSVEYGNYNI